MTKATPAHQGFENHLTAVLPPKLRSQVLGAVLQELAIAAPLGCLRSDLLQRIGPGDGSVYSPATLSKALSALEKADLISKSAVKAGPHGGRPPERYMIGSDLWAVVGVHISISQNRMHRVTCTVRDLSARLIDADSLPLGDHEDWGRIAKEVGSFVRQMIGKWQDGRPNGRVLGVGVEVPGHVHRGDVLEAPHSGWERVSPLAMNIGEALREDLTVVLDNDVNLIALREMYRPDRRTRPEDGTVVAVFDEGVGAGLIVGGRVHRGHRGAAGEPGHNPVFVGPGDPHSSLDTRDAPARAGKYPTFSDPCTCNKLHHIDCYAIPERIAGELGQPLSEFGRLAGEPAYDADGDLTPTGRAFWTAGSALGHGIVTLLHAHNPGWLLLLLPPDLADVDMEASPTSRRTAAALYRQAIETVVDEHAFSSSASDARRGSSVLEVRATADDPRGGPEKAARNAAVRVLDDFIAHALKRDECVREQSVEDDAAIPTSLDEREQFRDRLLALEQDLREILKKYDPEGLVRGETYANQYFAEQSKLMQLVMDERLDSGSVRELWERNFRASKLLADDRRLSDFTRALETVQARWALAGR